MEPHTPSGGILWGPTVSVFFSSIYVSPTLAARRDAESWARARLTRPFAC